MKLPTLHMYGSKHSKFILSESWLCDFAIYIVALAILATAMISLHALGSGLSGSDEGSHFLNSYFIWSYLSKAAGHNPMAYATDFYIHYPKISIGHWPPLYYAFLSVFFFVFPHTPFPFMVVNLVIGALPAFLVARVVRQSIGLPWAALAAITYVFIPISLDNTVRLMLDQALAGLCLLAALLWSAYAKEPSIVRGLAYASVAAAAILVKGNGWVLAVFPFFHIALTGRWRVLLNWQTYVSGFFALSIVGTWTVVTYKISSDGFNYAWGIDYFFLAISNFVPALYSNLGFAGSMAAFIGIVGSVFSKDSPELREVGRTGLAMVLATIIFHAVVPVDLQPRYMSSAIPYLAIFMTIGVWVSTQRWHSVITRPWVSVSVAIAFFCIPGMLYLQNRPARFDLRMDFAAVRLTGKPGGMVVVIDGNAGAEGALTAEVALRDPENKSYVVRSSQLLAKSDFMGKQYALRVNTPEGVLSLLDEISCNAVVVSDGPFMEPSYAHSGLLLLALRHPSSPFQLAHNYKHHRHDGSTSVYVRTVPLQLQLEAIRRVNFPAKAPQ